MQDILADLDRWHEKGKSIALATVIQTWGSSPRRAGAKMAFTLDGNVTGSVSGGCVENAVVEVGIQSLKTNRPRLLHFGVADESAWEVGLACGGSIDIFVKPLNRDFFVKLLSVIESENQLVIASVIRGPDKLLGRELLFHEHRQSTGWLGNDLNGQIDKLASETISQGTARRVALNDEIELFLEPILPPPTLIMVGGVHITVALSSLAKTLGYRTIVIDPRKAWGNKERFPNVDQLIQAWPDKAFGQINITRSTAIATLTHDPKLDDPALKSALSSPAFYVGALGSMSTQAKRRERLLQEGLTKSQLDRLHGPIGLDINARTPEEIALAIMAEVVDVHRNWKQYLVEKEAIELSSF
jgi:xanthine dehydrogenase accessory factor